MRHYVIASHGGFSKGIYESIKIIIGEQAGVDIITAFIDGKNDIEVLVNGTLEKIPYSDEIIVCTDVFGGRVNTEFMKQLKTRKNLYLITGMNLPLLMQLFLSAEENTERMILDIVNSEDTHVKYCNSMIETQDVEDDF